MNFDNEHHVLIPKHEYEELMKLKEDHDNEVNDDLIEIYNFK